MNTRRGLFPGATQLAPGGDLSTARALLEAYQPRDAFQAEQRERMLAFVDAHPDALLRTCLAGHLTASALVWRAEDGRGLLTLHRKLGRWLQLGGHVDGEGNLAVGALREAEEESGIAGLSIDPAPIDLDMHRIPGRGQEPEHWHLDVRFLVWAPPDAKERVSAESVELGWFTPDELEQIGADVSVRRLFTLLAAS
jgi:8-oxo-dGTP pyrophosphatase MutT (NUDIX family)